MRNLKAAVKALFSLALLAFSGAAVHANPLIYQQYTADPTASWFNNRMYIYCSHDITGQTSYVINNIYLMSSDDLVNWTDEGIPAASSNTSWAGSTYAPDSISRNGFYYIYYGNGGGSVGVFRGSSPTGPFTDPLGHALVTSGTAGVAPITYVFDPAAFIDDDGQAYLYFGGGGPGNARVIKLNSDMISVNGSAVSINASRYFEAPFMNKVNGTYYFTYSTDFSASPAASIDYLTSSNPMTGFTHRGTVLFNPPNNCGNNDHASIVNVGSNYYIAYHNRALAIQNGLTCSGNAVYQRSVNLDKVVFNSDGTIAVVTPTTAGVAALKNQDPYSTLRAVMMAKESGIQTQVCSEGGMNVTGTTNGSWIQVRNLDFGSGASSFSARVAGTVTGGSIQIRLDSTTGTLIGTCSVPSTGGTQTWQNVSCPISGATGLHDVYFVFAGGSGTLFNFESYSFQSSGPTATPTKTNTPVPPTSTFTSTSTRTSTPTMTFTFSSTPTLTTTSTSTRTATTTATATFTATKTNTPVPPTATATFTATLTATPTRTATPTSTATNTATFTPTKTNTPVPPTATSTFTPTKTNTPVPPTATSTNTPVPPTSTDSATATPTTTKTPTPSSTLTPTASLTATPTASPSQTFTQTAVPPTATFTATLTKTNTPVPPTATWTITVVPPTNTFTAEPPTATSTNTPLSPTSTFTSVPPTATSTWTITAVPPTATLTDTPVPPTATDTATATWTNTAVPPTTTFTASPTKTDTPVPPTATLTDTPVPATATDTATATWTNTAVPSTATFTATPTKTDTPVPPTATLTYTSVPPTFTYTSTKTNTPIPPTATFTSSWTSTPTPTDTRTSTRTFTPVPPTATSTNTPVPPTATWTAIPPTATSTPTVVVTTSFKVQLLSGVTSDTTNSPHPQIRVVNTGTGPLSLNNVTVKYWFNCDCTNQTLQAWVDWAGLAPVGTTATGNVQVSVQATSLGGQTDYVLYSFTGNLVLQPGQAIQVQSRFNKNDWSNMTQSNDWSFAPDTAFMDAPQVTGYMTGSLAWGQEPAGNQASLTVASALAFPNPSRGDGTTLTFTLDSDSNAGIAQPDAANPLGVDPNARITLGIYSIGMRRVWTQAWVGGAYGTTGLHEFYWTGRDSNGGQLANGLFYLRVTVESHGHTSSATGKILILR